MKFRTSALAFGITLALGAPFSVLAGGFWQATQDEAGSAIVVPEIGVPQGIAPAKAAGLLKKGEFSVDRQYVYLGGEGGWQIRPMEYAYEGGSFAHVDDPVGHMHRVANASPLTAAERIALERIGGS